MLNKITNLPIKIIATLSMGAYALFAYFTNMGCIILKLTGVKCLGCGMTRALLAALRLDFSEAFSQHFMFWSVPVLYLCFLFDGRLFKNKWANAALYIFFAVGFIVNWILRQFS